MAKMLSSKNSDPDQSLKITQHDKFYSRHLSKDSSMANPSFRIYYGGASGAVPFLWESQPGKPKNTITTNTLPPLTPPPSFHVSTKKNIRKKTKNSSLVHCILPARMKKRSTGLTPHSSSSSSLSWSTTISMSSSANSSGSHRCRFSSARSSFSVNDDEDSEGTLSSPTATLRGCFSMLSIKNLLLSIVGGHRSS